MLTSIGKHSKSLFLKILVGIIILPFIFWGMGDVFRGGNQNIVANIDSEKVSTKEFIEYLNRLGLSDEQRKNVAKNNTIEKILSEYIGKKIINLEINEKEIVISDETLREIIKNEKTFFKDNKFSRTEYEKFLLTSSITAVSFENNIVEQEAKRQLLRYLSDGIKIPHFLVQKEFNKENQNKRIKYLNLNNMYDNLVFDKKEIKDIYDKNKGIFVEIFKSFSFVELTPENLFGSKEYSEQYFKKIDQIENNILDGVSIKDITNKSNLILTNTEQLNKQKKNKNNIEFKIDDKLFQKIFIIDKEDSPELIKIENKYFLIQVNNIIKNDRPITDPQVKDAINAQLKLKNKFETNGKILEEITKGTFTLNKLESFAKEKKLETKVLILEDLKENKLFNKDLTKKIFEMNDGQLELVTDSMLSKNFVIYSEKTKFKSLEKNSEKYKDYQSKARFTFARKIYESYDKSVNTKYEISLNNKTIDRIKNSF